ncbi:hypothetical protein SISNIDRAFT_468263 [Sistotremastrum niveocremeum HHB9708]|uniref:Uncharacterized protein n=1 Tax=Sistotremastrum niveocremeum HHB9708 TaxID=1314777 RepID=A0A164RPJ7_9AGAM|nr:hypothetical protein SISNIDRAFT_468263 [Sistotremastrum niveocremeum HHB9708]
MSVHPLRQRSCNLRISRFELSSETPREEPDEEGPWVFAGETVSGSRKRQKADDYVDSLTGSGDDTTVGGLTWMRYKDLKKQADDAVIDLNDGSSGMDARVQVNKPNSWYGSVHRDVPTSNRDGIPDKTISRVVSFVISRSGTLPYINQTSRRRYSDKETHLARDARPCPR